MPMHKWMQSAAGGTSQRLKPGLATIRSLESSAGPASPTLALLTMVRFPFPRSLFGRQRLARPPFYLSCHGFAVTINASGEGGCGVGAVFAMAEVPQNESGPLAARFRFAAP